MLHNFVTVPSVDDTAESLVSRVMENEEAFLSTASSLPPLELTDDHLHHAKGILNRSAQFAEFRRSVCPMRVSDERFWNAYFTMLAGELGLKRRREATLARYSPEAIAMMKSSHHSKRASVASSTSSSGITTTGNRSPSLAERVLDVVAPRGPGATPTNRRASTGSTPPKQALSPGATISPKMLMPPEEISEEMSSAAAAPVPLIPGAVPPNTFIDGQQQIAALTEAATQIVASSAEVATRFIDDVAFAFAQLADSSEEDDDDASPVSKSRTVSPQVNVALATDGKDATDMLAKPSTICLTSLPTSAVELCDEVSAAGGMQRLGSSTCMKLVNWWAPSTKDEQLYSETSVNEEFSSYF